MKKIDFPISPHGTRDIQNIGQDNAATSYTDNARFEIGWQKQKNDGI
jgi:hypothetical protein